MVLGFVVALMSFCPLCKLREANSLAHGLVNTSLSEVGKCLSSAACIASGFCDTHCVERNCPHSAAPRRRTRPSSYCAWSSLLAEFCAGCGRGRAPK